MQLIPCTVFHDIHPNSSLDTSLLSTAASRLEAVKFAAKPPLCTLILGGNLFTGAVLAVALCKLTLRFDDLSKDTVTSNSLRPEAMLIMTSIIRVGQSKFVTVQIDEEHSSTIYGQHQHQRHRRY
ncbi:hypothetical protein F5146DRAFT_536172 [Armillaria mellea]|nr:hypothetical protein F5146DRAFT_536172 [Armillaria mellea]